MKVTLKLPLGKLSTHLIVRDARMPDMVERIPMSPELFDFMGKDSVLEALRTTHSDGSFTFERFVR